LNDFYKAILLYSVFPSIHCTDRQGHQTACLSLAMYGCILYKRVAA